MLRYLSGSPEGFFIGNFVVVGHCKSWGTNGEPVVRDDKVAWPLPIQQHLLRVW